MSGRGKPLPSYGGGNLFTLHIKFLDGSNPWVRFCMSPEEFGNELIKWSKKYNLCLDYVNDDAGFSCMVFMIAMVREEGGI